MFREYTRGRVAVWGQCTRVLISGFGDLGQGLKSEFRARFPGPSSEVGVQPMQSGGQRWGTWIPGFGAGFRVQGTGSGSQDLGVRGSEGPRFSVHVLGSETQGFSPEPGALGLRDGDQDQGPGLRGLAAQGRDPGPGPKSGSRGPGSPGGSGARGRARGRGPVAGHLRRRTASPRWP